MKLRRKLARHVRIDPETDAREAILMLKELDVLDDDEFYELRQRLKEMTKEEEEDA